VQIERKVKEEQKHQLCTCFLSLKEEKKKKETVAAERKVVACVSVIEYPFS
jgi:hypothetical protein